MSELLDRARSRPWSYHVSGDGVYINHETFGVTFGHYLSNGQGEADAALIVAAVNEYESLLLLERAMRDLLMFPFDDENPAQPDGEYVRRVLCRLDEIRRGS